MPTNCPSCGRTLTIKEGIKNRCSHCYSAFQRVAVRFGPREALSNSSFIKKNFDSLLAAELKKCV